MFIANIPPDVSHFYKKLILHYLKDDPAIAEFRKYTHSEAGLNEAIAQRQFDAARRNTLHQVLSRQYAPLHLKPGSPVQVNLDRLRENNTFTVTTGHQLNVFTGPVYFLYKIIHTIKRCDELSKSHPDKQFVPVFWMASEDHDIEEISSVHLGESVYRWNTSNTRQPVGRYDTDGLAELAEQMAADPFFAGEIPSWLLQAKEIYRSSETLGQATFRLVHQLFESYGLVILEPDQPELKALLKPVMESDILHGTSIRALETSNKSLAKKGYPLQVHGREINFFYLGENGRELIYKDKNGTYLVGEELEPWTREELAEEINRYPERFSPNVILRPVYQETILPNLAYVGGPGEVAYWLQLMRVFETHNVAFPQILLRNSFAVLPPGLQHQLQKLGLPVDLYFDRIDQVRVRALRSLQPTSEEKIATQIAEAYQSLINESDKLSNQLSSLLIEQKRQTETFFGNYTQKVRKQKEVIINTEFAKVNNIRATLFPGEVPAERIRNLLHFASRNDQQAFIQTIYAHTTPITSGVSLLAF